MNLIRAARLEPIPDTHVSRNFAWSEFAPKPLGEPERVLTRMFAVGVLEPLRSELGDAPIIINVGDLQARGWRDTPVTGAGAAGRQSDHMLLSVNGASCGAVDLNCPAWDAREPDTTFRVLADLAEAGIVPYPRVIIYEERQRADDSWSRWLHVSYPETYKQTLSFDRLPNLPLDYRLNRRAPWHPTASPKRWQRLWHYRQERGARLECIPVDAKLQPIR